jgi:hypothetical protein
MGARTPWRPDLYLLFIYVRWGGSLLAWTGYEDSAKRVSRDSVSRLLLLLLLLLLARASQPNGFCSALATQTDIKYPTTGWL